MVGFPLSSWFSGVFLLLMGTSKAVELLRLPNVWHEDPVHKTARPHIEVGADSWAERGKICFGWIFLFEDLWLQMCI